MHEKLTTHDAEHDPRNDNILIWVNGELKPRAEATVSPYASSEDVALPALSQVLDSFS